jgi:hypothetical protein
MKKVLFVSAVAFSITLGVVVSFRMSPDALAVIVGIVSGVLASVPTSVVLVWVLRQRDRQLDAQLGQGQTGHYPPVIVVNGQGANGYGQAPPMLSVGRTPNGGREFRVIGQENTESVGDLLPPLWEQD